MKLVSDPPEQVGTDGLLEPDELYDLSLVLWLSGGALLAICAIGAWVCRRLFLSH